MNRSYQQIKALDEIDRLTKKGQTLKRQGKVNEAVELLESHHKRIERDENIPDEAWLVFYKSIAKLYYVQTRIEKAIGAYISAIDYCIKLGDQLQEMTCAFHLGCCSDEFLQSPLAAEYLRDLQSGAGLPPGMPGSSISPEVVLSLVDVGLQMYARAEGSRRDIKSMEWTCAVCGCYGQTVDVPTMIQSQITPIGDGKYLITDFGDYLTAVDEKPKSTLLNRDLIRKWERAVHRRDSSFFCSACDTVFFKENGILKFSKREEFKRLVYED